MRVGRKGGLEGRGPAGREIKVGLTDIDNNNNRLNLYE